MQFKVWFVITLIVFFNVGFVVGTYFCNRNHSGTIAELERELATSQKELGAAEDSLNRLEAIVRRAAAGNRSALDTTGRIATGNRRITDGIDSAAGYNRESRGFVEECLSILEGVGTGD